MSGYGSKDDRGELTLDQAKAMTSPALTRNQVAQLFGVDPRTVTVAAEQKQIPSVKFGRRLVFPRLPIIKFLEDGFFE